MRSSMSRLASGPRIHYSETGDTAGEVPVFLHGWPDSGFSFSRVFAWLQDLADPVSPTFARDFQASTIYRSVPEAFFDRLVEESLKLPARLWREVLGGLLQYDDVDKLGGLTMPTLLIWGEKDALFPGSDQQELLAAIPGARLEIYREVGHSPNRECPERVASDLVDFFSENRLPRRRLAG